MPIIWLLTENKNIFNLFKNNTDTISHTKLKHVKYNRFYIVHRCMRGRAGGRAGGQSPSTSCNFFCPPNLFPPVHLQYSLISYIAPCNLSCLVCQLTSITTDCDKKLINAHRCINGNLSTWKEVEQKTVKLKRKGLTHWLAMWSNAPYFSIYSV
jgi:hypothetical protein